MIILFIMVKLISAILTPLTKQQKYIQINVFWRLSTTFIVGEGMYILKPPDNYQQHSCIENF